MAIIIVFITVAICVQTKQHLSTFEMMLLQFVYLKQQQLPPLSMPLYLDLVVFLAMVIRLLIVPFL